MNWNYEQLPPSDLKEVEVLFENGTTGIAYPLWRNFDIIEEKIVETESPVFASWMLKENEDSPIVAWREKADYKVEKPFVPNLENGQAIEIKSIGEMIDKFGKYLTGGIDPYQNVHIYKGNCCYKTGEKCDCSGLCKDA